MSWSARLAGCSEAKENTMVPKALLGGVVGFILGGLVVSTAATWLEEQPETRPEITTTDHNRSINNRLGGLSADSFDKAFLEEMIIHHEGAIEMARLAQTNAKHDEIKQLGRSIMSAQSQEIDMMQTWQGDWGYKVVHKSH